MYKKNTLLSIGLPILMILAMLAQTIPAQAQAPAPTVSSVEPDNVPNTQTFNLTITGSDFQEGAGVNLLVCCTLDTEFVSPNVLHAELPAGMAPGTYTVRVRNPDGLFGDSPVALTIFAPTATSQPPEPTATQVAPVDRPLIVVDTYSASEETIYPNQDFNLEVRLKNVGEATALNLVASFTPGDFLPRKSGGVLAISELDPDEKKKIVQPLTSAPDLSKRVGGLVMTVTYNGQDGTAYTETFNISLPVIGWGTGAAATATPTPTPAASNRPQLVITGYITDVPVLQPGYQFSLKLDIRNLGNMLAKRVSMILGGGSSSGGNLDGTPEVGGISGSSGDFGDFAPVAASNVQFLGDLDVGADIDAGATLIVNANTEPGAYPLKITFAYSDEKGKIYNDDQIITLLVYALPLVDVNFYRAPDPLFAGQPGILPLQVVNLGRKSVILGNMRVTAEGAQFTNNVLLVGALDLGGYYTLDATVIPDLAGPLQLLVSIDYTDDFNQPQVITRTLSVDVQEMIIEEPIPGEGGEGGIPISVEETFWQKVWRFIKGLIGLDSSVPTPVPGEMMPGEIPPGEIPPGGESKPMPAPVQGPKG